MRQTASRHARPGLGVLACLLTALAASPASGQSAGSSRDADGKIVIRATRLAQPLRVDGRLDDEIYSQVPPVQEFIQQEPREGEPATERTDAWVLFDDDNFYVVCRCWTEDPSGIVANDLRRDGSHQSQQDQFAFTIDTFHDGRNSFFFAISPIGGMRDGMTTDERLDLNWNGVWGAKSARFDGGWVTEMAIPFKTLRYGRQPTWGIQMRRFVTSKNERTHLTRLSPESGVSAIHFVSQGATLTNMEIPPPGLNLEIKPYAISRMLVDRVSRLPVDGFEPDAGLDVKYGVTKSLTADFTYRTDFAQVEADEAQVNLTRFNLSFPEKREFFLEGAGIFAFGNGAGAGASTQLQSPDQPTIFYSRRIGLSGTRDVPVIGGGRFTGRAGPWDIGAFTMATDDDAATGALVTNFTVMRVRRSVLRRSSVGAIYTRRSVSTLAPGANDVWGVDANLGFRQNVFFAGYVAQSRTSGIREDDLAYRAQFNYPSDRYGFALERLVVERNFSPEIGFLRRQDFRRNFVQGRFSPRTARNRLVRRFVYQAGGEYVTNNQDRLESREASGVFRTEFHNGDSVGVEHSRILESLPQPFEIATGVQIPVGTYVFSNTRISLGTGQSHRLAGNTSFEIGSFYGGHRKSATVNGRLDITPQMGVEPTVSLNWIDLPQGRFTNSVVGGRGTYSASAQMFVSALVQYSSATKSVLTNVRFRWEYQPGSEFFVVLTEGRSTLPPRGTELQTRGFVVKINRLLRF